MKYNKNYTSRSKITVSDSRSAVLKPLFDIYKHPDYGMVVAEDLHTGSTIEIEPDAVEELVKAIQKVAKDIN